MNEYWLERRIFIRQLEYIHTGEMRTGGLEGELRRSADGLKVGGEGTGAMEDRLDLWPVPLGGC